MGVSPIIGFLSFRLIFHFHDYGRKGSSGREQNPDVSKVFVPLKKKSPPETKAGWKLGIINPFRIGSDLELPPNFTQKMVFRSGQWWWWSFWVIEFSHNFFWWSFKLVGSEWRKYLTPISQEKTLPQTAWPGRIPSKTYLNPEFFEIHQPRVDFTVFFWTELWRCIKPGLWASSFP